MSVLSKPYFHNEAEAFRFVEGVIWPHGPTCFHCGATDRIYPLQGVRSLPSKKNPEGVVRHGLKKCGHCRKQFTVRMGTIFEESKLPLTKWLQAIFLMCASKKGVSAHQLHRTLEVTYKTAWFLAHRIREAMRSGDLGPFGMGGATVEIDETFIGNDPDAPAPKRGGKRGIQQMMKVVSLVERETGRVRSVVIDNYGIGEVQAVLRENLSREAHLRTDESGLYVAIGKKFASHMTTNHASGQYVNLSDRSIHSNTVEGYFSIFKRGMRGVCQHCAKKHLHRYMAEFDFRYSNRVALGVDDQMRARMALQGVVGKRLTYRRPDRTQEAQA